MDSGRTVAYSYDSLYRLASAVTNGSTNYIKWGLTWTYDRYGNRLGQSSNYDSPPTNSVSVDATTNRINTSGYAFDANGNMTNDGNNTLVYDAENRMLSATNGGGSGTYTYDGNNLRVKKVSGSTTTVYIFSGSKVVAEYDNGAAPSSPSREYIYSGAALLAKIDSSGTTYYHQDHLSNRLITDGSGNTLAQQGHYPYGEQWYPAPPASPATKWEFTERDSESGNDYAMMRSYVNRLPRFSSPDPLSGSAANPQSLNSYSYALNSPSNLVDPLGLDPCFDPATGTTLPCPDITSVTVNGDGPYTPYFGIQSIYGGGAGGTSSSEVPLMYDGEKHGGGRDPFLPSRRQTFSECMTANSSTFSLAGLAQGAINTALNAMGMSSISFQDTWWAKLVGGNSISGLLYGSPDDAGMTAAALTPGVMDKGVGAVTTFGRRTSTIVSLNLAGNGGLPRALSSSTTGLKSFLGAADSVLSLGMSLTQRLAVDAALAAAEAAYCGYKTR